MTISAKIIQDSISTTGKRITTYELEYPRFIHAELMTHRMFSRNSASSRAIPIKKMNENILNSPARPVHWGKNQAGMQAKEELNFSNKSLAHVEWDAAMRDAVKHSDMLDFLGVHKQIANRTTEPYQVIKVVLTTTEDANWFWLRDHEDAQPEIRELARQMQIAKDSSVPFELFSNEWHVPYVQRRRDENGSLVYFVTIDSEQLTVEEAQFISASCCAQVSYRRLDDTLEKAKDIFKRLVESKPVHASPCEHQATPINNTDTEFKDTVVWKRTNHTNLPETWQAGITHVDRNGKFWSGNFCGWIQFRQLIPENAMYG